jgi:hypothetical protein
MIPKRPFTVCHKDYAEGVHYTITDSSVVKGGLTVSWQGKDMPHGSPFVKAGSSECKFEVVEGQVDEGRWVVVEEAALPLKVALKIRLFEMRIEAMENSLAALKREFAHHKQDVKETI